MKQCHDCGVYEGEIHELGCDMEKCPWCGGQNISCGCMYKLLGIDVNPGTWAYEHGLTEEQEKEWLKLLEEKGRIPYIKWPNICRKCGKLWPDMFSVPDEEWEEYIEPSIRDKMVCLECYTEIKNLIDVAANKRCAVPLPPS